MSCLIGINVLDLWNLVLDMTLLDPKAQSQLCHCAPKHKPCLVSHLIHYKHGLVCV